VKVIEIGIKGVLPFNSLKLQFKKGLNVVIGENSSGKTTIFNCFLASLFNEGWKELHEKIKISGSEPAKAFVTFRNDTSIYRVIRELSTGGFILYKYEPSTKTFKEISKDPFSLSSLLEDNFHLFPFHIYRKFFCATHTDLPSFSEAKKVAIVKEESLLRKEKKEGTAKEEVQKRIKELSSELDNIKKVEEKEELLNDLERKLFQIKEKKGKRENLRSQIELLSQTVKENAPLEELSQDVEGKLANYKKLLKEREKIRSAFVHEVEPLKEEIQKMGGDDFLKSPFVKYGSILFGSSLLLFIIRNPILTLIKAENLSLPLRFIFLPIIIGSLGMVGWGLFKEFGRRAKKEELMKQLREKEFRLKKMENQIELELKKIDIITKEIGLMSPDDLPEKVNYFNQIKKELEEAKAELDKEVQSMRDEDLIAEEEKLTKEVEALKKELQDIGSISGSKQEIEEELKTLQESLETGVERAEETTIPSSEPLRSADLIDYLDELSRVMGQDRENSLSSLYNNLVPILKDLSKEKFETITFEEDKIGMRNSEGEFFPFDFLSSSILDMAFVTLLLSFVDYQSSLRNIPFILDDIFITMDDSKREKFYMKVKEIAERTGQGIVLSRFNAIEKFADNVLRI